jgi:putative phosphoesterase
MWRGIESLRFRRTRGRGFMLLGLISDTHDNVPMIRRALAFFAKIGADCLIHAGDFVAPFALREIVKFRGPVYAIFGNNDGERAGLRKILPDLQDGPRRINICEKNITILHDEKDLGRKDRAGSDVIVAGHSHRPKVSKGRPLIVNPGECCGWVYGKGTVATLDTETLEVKIVELKRS